MRFIKIMFLILRGWHLTLAAPLHIQTIIHKVSNALERTPRAVARVAYGQYLIIIGVIVGVLLL